MKTDYTKFTKEQLKDKLIELEMRVMQSYSGLVEAKEKKENRNKLKKEIAKIKTELNKRK